MTEAARRTAGTESGRRLLSALLTFSADSPALSVADLATAVGVSASTAYRYVSLLREVGLVEPAGDGAYRLTDRVTALAEAVTAGRDDVATHAGPVLRELRDQIDETVLVVRRGGDYAYCIAREESTQPVRLQFAVGQAMPLHRGSAPRVLLAAMPDRERSRYLDLHALDVSDELHARLSDESLDEVARDRWTQSFEEVDTGIWGTAAAITHGANGPVVAALGTAGPLYRLNDTRRADVVAAIRAAAAAISASLGESGVTR